MGFWEELFYVMKIGTVVTVCGLLASLPIAFIVHLAIERGSWLLGVLAFFVLIAIASIAVVIQERLEVE